MAATGNKQGLRKKMLRSLRRKNESVAWKNSVKYATEIKTVRP
jgi:hypothetical protein